MLRSRALVLLGVLAALQVLEAGRPDPTPVRQGSGARPARTPRVKHAKIETALVHLAEAVRSGRPRAEQQDPEALTRGREIAVTVRLRSAGQRAAVEAIVGARGGSVINAADRVVEAWVPADALEPIAALDAVTRLERLRRPRPLVYSQGVSGHNAPAWHAVGLHGTGVKVGIIDGGFSGFSGLMGREVPAAVTARCYSAPGIFSSALSTCESATAHGTAVAETIHDVAPAALLYLANPQSRLDLQATVSWMAGAGVRVINYSVGWMWDGPGDGTSPYSDSPLLAVSTAVASGITWINAAGNEGLANWYGPATSIVNVGGFDMLQFSTGVTFNPVALVAGVPVTVQARWQDAWGGAVRDYDLCVYAPDQSFIGCSDDLQNGGVGHVPHEAFTITAAVTGTYYLTIEWWDGPSYASWAQLTLWGADLGVRTPSYSIATPADSASAGLLAVGASGWTAPTLIQSYSSQGPTTDNRAKPDIVGLDGASTATYGAFFGTSQAAPHVSGLAALVREAYPAYTPSQVTTLLRSMASPRSGAYVWGSGLAMLSTPCTFTLSAMGQSFGGAAAGAGSVNVATLAGCSWTAATTAPWIHITSGSSGLGNGTVGYSIDENAGPPRSGTITAGGWTYTVMQGGTLPTLAADRTALRFGAVNSAASLTAATSSQVVRLTQAGAGTVSWFASSNQPWLTVTPGGGTGSGQLTVGILNRAGILPSSGSLNGAITITPIGAGGAPITVPVSVTTYVPGTSSAPFGHIDTPANLASGIQGAIGVTGWALDDVQVQSVKVYRDPVAVDPPAAIGPNGKVYIGDAAFLPGARPDVEAAFASAPLNYRAGWGLMILTNMLPDLTALTSAGGNGTFALHADAFDAEGRVTRLASRTITVNNAAATRPFGTLDTPSQGGTAASVAFPNFGWALAPIGRLIPTDGSTMWVFIDGLPVGRPTYNQCRAPIVDGQCTDDIATLFPAYGNKNGAIGSFVFDTTTMANGLHTIAWSVTDDTGAIEGIGSRFFDVFNGTPDAPLPTTAVADAPALGQSLARLDAPERDAIVSVAQGYAIEPALAPLASRPPSGRVLRVKELDRVVLQVRGSQAGAWSAYQAVGGALRELPIGATFDARAARLAWQLGPGFVGGYDLVFVRTEEARFAESARIRVIVQDMPADPGLFRPAQDAARATDRTAPARARAAMTAAQAEVPSRTASIDGRGPASVIRESSSGAVSRADDTPGPIGVAPPATGWSVARADAPVDTLEQVTVTLDARALWGEGVSQVRWTIGDGEHEGMAISVSLAAGDHQAVVTAEREGLLVMETFVLRIERARDGIRCAADHHGAGAVPAVTCGTR